MPQAEYPLKCGNYEVMIILLIGWGNKSKDR